MECIICSTVIDEYEIEECEGFLFEVYKCENCGAETIIEIGVEDLWIY